MVLYGASSARMGSRRETIVSLAHRRSLGALTSLVEWPTRSVLMPQRQDNEFRDFLIQLGGIVAFLLALAWLFG